MDRRIRKSTKRFEDEGTTFHHELISQDRYVRTRTYVSAEGPWYISANTTLRLPSSTDLARCELYREIFHLIEIQ